MLVDKGRLTLDRDVADWLDQADLIEGLELVAMDREIGIQLVFLPGDFHKDPADRIIVATARKFASPVVTADERIIAYPARQNHLVMRCHFFVSSGKARAHRPPSSARL